MIVAWRAPFTTEMDCALAKGQIGRARWWSGVERIGDDDEPRPLGSLTYPPLWRCLVKIRVIYPGWPSPWRWNRLAFVEKSRILRSC